jgi:hypothetical protein
MPDGLTENEFIIDWQEDVIISYQEPSVYAIKRPTWRINPTIKLEHLKNDFWRDPVDALSRFACMPPESIDAFFKDKDKIESAFPLRPVPFDEGWRFANWFVPDPEKRYYVHVDLGYKHDRAAVALAHVEDWVKVSYGKQWESTEPVVKIDAVRWWTPKSDKNVDFSEVKNYIISLKRRGFQIKLVTFDRWQSINIMNELKQFGLNSESLSVAKPHYEDLAMLVSENRLRGYHIDILKDELLGLRIIKGNKVDHARKGSNDLADAICGAAYNASKYTPRNTDRIIDIQYLEPSAPKPSLADLAIPKPKAPAGVRPAADLSSWIEQMKIID